jgi:hypothetical protein
MERLRNYNKIFTKPKRIKGIFRQKPRWVIEGISQQFFLYLTYNFSNLKGHHPLKLIKPVLACKHYTNKHCSINVVPATNSVYPSALVLMIISIPVN